MVAVFRQVRRVLRKDGTLWLNIGDSYATGTSADRNPTSTEGPDVPASWSNRSQSVRRHPAGMKPKDLVGIPWRLAFALQADGWYLRSDIVWSKPNPMPESVTDRPTKSHEYVFLLTRSPRYFYDADAVREDYAPKTLTHRGGGKAAGKVGQQDDHGKVASGNYGEWDKSRTAFPPPRPQEETLDGSDGEAPRGPDGRRKTHVEKGDASIQHRDGERWPNDGRNVRSVWEIATQPYPEAHFATYPEALVERCVKAGSPEGGTVLDPFMGSGTTALVARKHGRRSVGIELNETYAELAAKRLSQLSLLAA
jgi:DNA modification methylase